LTQYHIFQEKLTEKQSASTVIPKFLFPTTSTYLLGW